MVRYGLLLVLAAAIATSGVIHDSTATVIGAMIVAPLATPIIAVALGIVTVRPGQVARSAAIVAGSIAAVIALGAVLSWILRDPVNVMTNSQIQGRISPNLTDLFVACAERSGRSPSYPTAMVVVWILFGVTVIPLAYATVTTAYQAQVQQEATTAAESWLSGSAYSLATVSFVDGQVVLRVVGTGPLPPQEGFDEAFTSPVGRPVDVAVEQVAGQTVELGSVS